MSDKPLPADPTPELLVVTVTVNRPAVAHLSNGVSRELIAGDRLNLEVNGPGAGFVITRRE